MRVKAFNVKTGQDTKSVVGLMYSYLSVLMRVNKRNNTSELNMFYRERLVKQKDRAVLNAALNGFMNAIEAKEKKVRSPLVMMESTSPSGHESPDLSVTERIQSILLQLDQLEGQELKPASKAKLYKCRGKIIDLLSSSKS